MEIREKKLMSGKILKGSDEGMITHIIPVEYSKPLKLVHRKYIHIPFATLIPMI